MHSKWKDFPQNNAMSNIISHTSRVPSMQLFGENKVLWEMMHSAPTAAVLDQEY